MWMLCEKAQLILAVMKTRDTEVKKKKKKKAKSSMLKEQKEQCGYGVM